MSSKQEQQKNDLENIIRALADVWPADRDNVMTAGAQFEEIIDKLDNSSGQLQKLIDLAWKGLKHIYEKDEYFISVKTATMQAVNTIREFVIKDGDIQVEDFEKACTDLETALSGKSESVDEIIDPDAVKPPGPEELEDIIRALADVWPADRDNVMTAGAKFEEIINKLDNSTGQLQKLIDLAWKGLKHLYEKDEYFISVKTATMQAVNTIREYEIKDGDIQVEDFEKACTDLDKALSGKAESADELVELKEKEAAGPEDLEDIIRALADVWPADRDNVMVAGAKFEEIIDGFDKSVGQLQKLIDLAWKGLKHLYEKDEHFTSVKTATMQAVNTIREYVIKDGDIQVEDFEKACTDLDKALSGGAESADEIIELDEETTSQKEGVSLDDLASFIMTLDEGSVSEESLKKLTVILEELHPKHDKPVAEPLKEALEIAQKALSAGKKKPKNWLSEVSEKTEAAIEIEMDENWQETTETPPEKPAAKAVKETNPETEVFTIPEDTEVEMLGEFITECTDLIETAESALLDLEESPDDDELINTVFRAFHTIKGTSAFMGLDPISEFTHSVETLLSMVREGDLPFDMACADINLESIDIIKQMLEVIETSGGGDPLPKPDGFDNMLTVLINIYDEGVEPAKALAKVRGSAKKAAPAPPTAESAPEQKKTASKPEAKKAAPASANNGTSDKNTNKSEAESTVRVNVNRLDRLIDMVGELVIAHSVVAQEESISKDTELQKKVNHTSKILRELQDTSLTLRMVPLKATFHKMNRLVRDISRKAGKPIKFSTIGEDTEIDRNMVDIINEPLVHMLRNAIDHGVEDPEQREASGKPTTANVYLKAFQEGGKVVIEIEDDGRGIDKDKILEKAISKGLIEPDKKLSESEIYNLIFLPGFSSVDKVTDLSGRGVGMDVVKRSIEQLQGKIDVTSQLGKGTKLTIELPFTLAITDGMLVRVGGQRFIVPTINIDMTFRAVEEELFTVMGSAEQVSFRGKSVPVIRLHRIFEIENGIEDVLQGTLLVIKNNNKRYALLVDEVIGQQQLVGKSINMMVKMPHISGGAILGDGRVGLILDTGALVMN